MELSLSQRALWANQQPISDLISRALANPGLISLAAGFVDQQSLPAEAVRQAFRTLMVRGDAARAALQYGTTLGNLRLRELIAERLIDADASGGQVPIERIMLTAGSNQLLHLIADTLLDPGDIVLTAAPTYLVMLGTLNNIGARAVGVHCDEQGMVPEALADTLQQLEQQGLLPRVKAIYVVPYFDNPTGTTMPLARRAEIVELAKKWSRHHTIFVISDEAYRPLRYDGEDIPSTRVVDETGETVIEAGTFSKSFSPGVRVGWGVLPERLIEPLEQQKGNIDFGSPHFAQALMAEVLEQGLFEPHLQRLRSTYATKRDTMLRAAEKYLAELPGVHWCAPDGGLYVWLRLPSELDAGPDGPLLERALAEGVLYVPGQYCYPSEGEPVEANTIRLSFGVPSCERITQGVQALARAIEAALPLTSGSKHP